ncbi:Phosphoribosylamine--glycine ligase [compost metagenome]
MKPEGNDLVNAGGRVFGVTALAGSKIEARYLAYQDIRKMGFSGMYFREDIAK